MKKEEEESEEGKCVRERRRKEERKRKEGRRRRRGESRDGRIGSQLVNGLMHDYTADGLWMDSLAFCCLDVLLFWKRLGRSNCGIRVYPGEPGHTVYCYTGLETFECLQGLIFPVRDILYSDIYPV